MREMTGMQNAEWFMPIANTSPRICPLTQEHTHFLVTEPCYFLEGGAKSLTTPFNISEYDLTWKQVIADMMRGEEGLFGLHF